MDVMTPTYLNAETVDQIGGGAITITEAARTFQARFAIIVAASNIVAAECAASDDPAAALRDWMVWFSMNSGASLEAHLRGPVQAAAIDLARA